MKFLIIEERSYIADAEKLKGQFPDEYQEFLERGGRHDDRAWVDDCLASGGFELFELQDSEYTVDPA